MRASLIVSATLASALRCPILRVGRPMLPLDAIGYGIPPAVFDQIVSEAEDPSAVVIGLQHRDAAAGTLCVLDATRAEIDGGRVRAPAAAVGRYRRLDPAPPRNGALVAMDAAVAPLVDRPRSGDASREARAHDAWLQRSLARRRRRPRGCGAALREMEEEESSRVLRFAEGNPLAALEAGALRPPGLEAFAASRRELLSFALARATDDLDVRDAAGLLATASTSVRLDYCARRLAREGAAAAALG
mmetsp:Transcript_32652/g.101048  ORF Transcript_32652/g.101048 Transcript_32652/m.101048 type:complete len:246 (+) Transcript_32652:328-1065(+)